MKKISIVTISFNQARFIEEAICSILEQKGVVLDYIVVDPGSTDGSREIIEQYRDDITTILFEPDDGPADGLIKGFRHATGEIFGYINADDALLPGALGKIAALFEENPELDVACGGGFKIDQDGNRMERIIPTHFSTRAYVYGAVTFLQQATFFRREAYLEVGGFNIENRTSWDGELLLDMSVAGRKFGILHDDLALFRIHPDSISGSGRLNDRYIADCARLFRKVKGRDKNGYDEMLAKGYLVRKWLTHPRVILSKILG